MACFFYYFLVIGFLFNALDDLDTLVFSELAFEVVSIDVRFQGCENCVDLLQVLVHRLAVERLLHEFVHMFEHF